MATLWNNGAASWGDSKPDEQDEYNQKRCNLRDAIFAHLCKWVRRKHEGLSGMLMERVLCNMHDELKDDNDPWASLTEWPGITNAWESVKGCGFFIPSSITEKTMPKHCTIVSPCNALWIAYALADDPAKQDLKELMKVHQRAINLLFIDDDKKCFEFANGAVKKHMPPVRRNTAAYNTANAQLAKEYRRMRLVQYMIENDKTGIESAQAALEDAEMKRTYLEGAGKTRAALGETKK